MQKTNYSFVDCADHYEFVAGGIKKRVVKIDKNDLAKVERCFWHINSKGYAQRLVSKGKYQLLHHYLFGRKDGFLVDHINRDRLDNRKSNLRFVTRSGNNFNHKVRNTSKSGITGVSWKNKSKCWVAKIGYNNTTIELCHTKDKNLAIAKRLEAEEKARKILYENLS